MSKVIKKFRKNMGYDDFSSKTKYDPEFQHKKSENKVKSKQARQAKSVIDNTEDDGNYYPTRRYY